MDFGTYAIPPSIPVGPGVLGRALALLDRVETLPADAVGALRFGDRGSVLVESRLVCWAVASDMQHRLTELLRHQQDPPLDRAHFVELYRQCKDDNAPLVEALLSRGGVSASGLRAALFRHTAEAIAHLAMSDASYEGFVPHAPYRARFLFSTNEILACLGARGDPALALAAQRTLEDTLVPDTSGWAFVRDGSRGAPVVVAVKNAALRGEEMIEICAWVSSLFDVTQVFDDAVRIASASWPGGRYVVAWRERETYFAAASANRAGAARLVAAVDERLMPSAERAPNSHGT